MATFQIILHSFFIEAPRDRQDAFDRLQKAIQRCEAIIHSSSPKVNNATRIQAMRALADLIRAASALIKESQLDAIEKRIAGLEKDAEP